MRKKVSVSNFKTFSISKKDILSKKRNSSIDSEIGIPKNISNFNFEIDHNFEGIDSNIPIKKMKMKFF